LSAARRRAIADRTDRGISSRRKGCVGLHCNPCGPAACAKQPWLAEIGRPVNHPGDRIARADAVIIGTCRVTRQADHLEDIKPHLLPLKP